MLRLILQVDSSHCDLRYRCLVLLRLRGPPLHLHHGVPGGEDCVVDLLPHLRHTVRVELLEDSVDGPGEGSEEVESHIRGA